MTDTPATVSSFADVLRAVSPEELPYAEGRRQRAVAAALDWFVVQAPRIASEHCLDLVPGIPVKVVELRPVTAERARRPKTFRRCVTELKRALDATEEPCAAAGARRAPGERGQLAADSGRALLGPVGRDLLYAASWLGRLGTAAGDWSCRWIGQCLRIAALEGDASRDHLAAKLIDSYRDTFAMGTIGKEHAHA